MSDWHLSVGRDALKGDLYGGDHGRSGGIAIGIGIRRGFRSRCHRRSLRCHRGWFFCGGVRRYTGPGIRTHRSDDGGDGAIVAEHAGNLAEAFTIVLLGGAFQIALGLLRVGRFVSYTPYTVVSGFMSGIGVIIIVVQVLPAFGLPTGRRAADRRDSFLADYYDGLERGRRRPSRLCLC